jgi:hypothetical protein
MRKRQSVFGKVLGVVRKSQEPDLFTQANDPLLMAKKTVEDLNTVRTQIKPLERREKELGSIIKTWGVGVYPGFTSAIEVVEQNRDGFDMDLFKAEQPEMHAKYKRTKPVRVANTIPLVKG